MMVFPPKPYHETSELNAADKDRRAAADFPGTDLEVVMAMLGSDNCKAASSGSKQFTVRSRTCGYRIKVLSHAHSI